MAKSNVPEDRAETIRESLRRVLRDGPATLRDLSGLVGVSEKDLLGHLEHLERSVRRGEEQLVIEPAKCMSCEFEFSDRKRFTRPGKCPQCKGTRIALPRFHLSGG